jgi:uncharacterized membrane protein (UPF0127 family)
MAAMPLIVYNARDGRILADRVKRADRFWSRFKGLLGRQTLEQGEGLHIVPCNSIHMFFMRFAIDVAFLDADGSVVRAVHAIAPWRITRVYLAAESALELAAGTLARAGVREGDRLLFREKSPEGSGGDASAGPSPGR